MSSLLPLERRPRLLGVTFDTLFIFSPHIDSIIGRASSRMNILRAIAGTNWDQQKEIIASEESFLLSMGDPKNAIKSLTI